MSSTSWADNMMGIAELIAPRLLTIRFCLPARFGNGPVGS